MTDKDRNILRQSLEEAVAIQLKNEYTDEDDFERKFGKTDTLCDAAELFTEYKCDEDIINICSEWVRAFPEDKQELICLFGLAEDDIGELSLC